jgi:hypothetical protein
LVGKDNLKNGADRIVNGVTIQTKYCNGGGKCISECFDRSGQFKYLKSDGTPMQIEVPSDMYDAAVQSMQEKIRQGKVHGIKDPRKAVDLVRKGNVTYEQAKNVARFGTVEGLTFDATNGVQVAAGAGSVSAAITFALSIWRGESTEDALEAACCSGLLVGGVAFLTTIATSQVGRTGLEVGLRPASDWMVSQLGPKTTRWIANNLRNLSGEVSLSGAAATNHVSKLLRGNVVTAAVTTIVLSTGDFVRLFQGRISGAQAFKNIASTGASVAGGIGGAAMAGAALGSVIPGPGNAIGFIAGAIGGVIGGLVAGKTASAMLDGFIEDDANQMLAIVNDVFSRLAVDYLLSEEEASDVIAALEQLNLVEHLRDMYAAEDRKDFAADLLQPLIEGEVQQRPPVQLPSPSQFMSGIKKMVDATIAVDDQEHRIRLKSRVGRIAKWGALVGLVIFCVNQCANHQVLKTEEVPTINKGDSAESSQVYSHSSTFLPSQTKPVAILPSSSTTLVEKDQVPVPHVTQALFPDVDSIVAYQEFYNTQAPVLFYEHAYQGKSLPFIQGIYDFSGTLNRQYRIVFGVSLFQHDPYLDALIYQKVDGGWVVHSRQLHFHDIIREELPVSDPTAIQVIHAEEDQVTLGVRFDFYPGKGDSNSARIYLIRFNEEPIAGSDSLSFIKPFLANAVNGGILHMPLYVLFDGRPAYLSREINTNFNAASLYLEGNPSYVCNIVKNPDPFDEQVFTDTCSAMNITLPVLEAKTAEEDSTERQTGYSHSATTLPPQTKPVEIFTSSPDLVGKGQVPVSTTTKTPLPEVNSLVAYREFYNNQPPVLYYEHAYQGKSLHSFRVFMIFPDRWIANTGLSLGILV